MRDPKESSVYKMSSACVTVLWPLGHEQLGSEREQNDELCRKEAGIIYIYLVCEGALRWTVHYCITANGWLAIKKCRSICYAENPFEQLEPLINIDVFAHLEEGGQQEKLSS